MKFKNSYILLIAMAIFLLVSIGSVCANENITTDSDVLASTDSDVVLADGDNANAGTTNEKINTTIEATCDKEKYSYDDEKNITVSVKDNESKELSVNENDLGVFEGKNKINFTYNNTQLTILDKLAVGTHNLTINYLGNSNYTNSTTNILLKIFGNATLNAPNEVISDGTTVKITDITVFDGVDNLTLTKDGFKLNLTYKNTTGDINSILIDDFTYDNGSISFEKKIEWLSANITLNYTDAANTKKVIIKLNTTVDASDAKINEKEDKNITVNVMDSQSSPLTITKSDLKVMENGKDIAFEYSNSIITIKSLTKGNHTITIVYKGNETYISSSKTVIVGVWGTQEINPDKTASVDENKKVNFTLNLNDGVDPVAITKDNLTITLFITKDNTTTNRTVSEFDVDNQNIIFEVPESFESAYIDIKYEAENNLTGKTTIKVGSEITASDFQKGESEVKNFTVEIKGTNGQEIDVTNSTIQVLKNGKAVKFSINNSVVTITDKIGFGKYNITIKYLGNDTFAEATKDIVLTVYGINATSSVNVNSTKKGEVKIDIINGNATVNITADDIVLNVTYKKDNQTYVIPVTVDKFENGTLYFTLEDGNFTTATLNIKYNATETNVTLNRIYNVNIIPVTVSADYQDGNFTFKLIDIDTNEVLANKSVTITMKKGDTQIYFITKNSSGSINLGTSTTLTSDENGIVTLANKGFYPGLVIGAGETYAPIGTYEVTITGTGGVNGTNKTNVTINVIDVKITLENFNEYYGSTKKVKITVTNAKTGKTVSGVYILLNITGATLSSPRQITDENGTIQLGVSGLPTGEYKMTFSSNDTNLNNTTSSGSFNIIKIPVVINGKDVSVYFNTGTTYTIKVTKDGKGVEGVYVFVRLYSTSKKYNDYLFQTNKNGQISFSASLAVGKHKVIVTLADTRYSASQITKTITVKKASAKITAKKVTAYYKGGKYFTVKVTNSKNKKAIYDAKVNIKIFVSKNRYYNYNGNTGMNGQLKLLLDTLKPGSYKVVVAGADSKNFAAKKVTSKIVIKKAPTKFVIQKTAKKSKKYLKITVKNKKTKKVIPKIKIKVKVYTGKKSKTYTLKTNAKGIAKLNIKKLKVGKHKVVVTSANKYCTAKKTTKTVKIKK